MCNRVRVSSSSGIEQLMVDENAEQIGKLQGRVSQLEGQVQFLLGLHSRVVKIAITSLEQDQKVMASLEGVPE